MLTGFKTCLLSVGVGLELEDSSSPQVRSEGTDRTVCLWLSCCSSCSFTFLLQFCQYEHIWFSVMSQDPIILSKVRTLAGELSESCAPSAFQSVGDLAAHMASKMKAKKKTLKLENVPPRTNRPS